MIKTIHCSTILFIDEMGKQIPIEEVLNSEDLTGIKIVTNDGEFKLITYCGEIILREF